MTLMELGKVNSVSVSRIFLAKSLTGGRGFSKVQETKQNKKEKSCGLEIHGFSSLYVIVISF